MNEAHRLCGSDEWRALVRDSILPWAVGELDLGADVLEIGPGYGATTEVLAERLPRLTTVEIDPELAATLVRRYAGTHVRVVVGDGTALDLDDGRFTAVVCFSMLHHVPSADLQDQLFAEAVRVLRPGGVLVASDSLASDDLRALHDGDTYVPVDPSGIVERWAGVGLPGVEVRTNAFGWAAVGSKG